MKAVQVFATLAFAATFAAAAPQALSQCNTGSASCCNSVQESSSDIVQELEGLLGIALGGITGSVGLGCSPISVVGIGGGASCNSQAVCCTDAEFEGLINLGCSPLNL